MPKSSTVIMLANSRKKNARCIAGIEIRNHRPHNWIRPIDSKDGTVASYYRTYEDGTEPALGDVVTMSLHKPEGRTDHQRENYRLDTTARWHKLGTCTWPQLLSLPISSDPLWLDSEASHSYHGINDRVRLSHASGLASSLRLVRVPQLQVQKVQTGQLRGTFSLAGKEYCLRITDPVFEHRYHDRSEGRYQTGEHLLTISLGEPFQMFCYKLIAGVMQREHFDND